MHSTVADTMVEQQLLERAQSSLYQVHDLWGKTPAFQDVLPAFGDVAEAVPVTKPFLDPLTTNHVRLRGEDKVKQLHQLHQAADELLEIFKHVSGFEQAFMVNAYHKTVSIRGKDHDVETLMRTCLGSLKHLDSACFLDTSRDDLKKLNEACQRLLSLEPSVPEALFPERVPTNNAYNSGAGNQFVMTGTGNQNVACGQGAQYNGVVNQYTRV
jgi:hypothetical protein